MNAARILSVIMPVYNEAETVQDIVARVESSPVVAELLIVDDGSTDGTREILNHLPAPLDGIERRIILQEKNQGKGACIRTGIANARGELLIIQDADLEYNPGEFPALIAPLVNNQADVVYGSRYKAGPTASPRWHTLVNRFLTGFSNLFTGLALTDMETCYKVFRTAQLKKIPLRSNRFGFEPEITAKIGKLNLKVAEVPVSYNGRTHRQGKKINWTDGVSALYTIVKFSLISDVQK